MSDPSSPSIAQIVEPDPIVHQALTDLVGSKRPTPVPITVADDLAPPVAIIGPNADLDPIETLHASGVATFVLRHKAEQVVEALRRGASDAALYPIDRAEFEFRVSLAAARAATMRAAALQSRDLTLLVGLSASLTTTANIEATLHQIARNMADVTASERCSIILLNDVGEQGVVIADSEDSSLANKAIAINSYPEILEVIRIGTPLVIHDVTQAPLFDPVRDIIKNKPVGNTALFPVRINDRVLGVIMLRGPDVRTEGLSERQMQFGALVANATAIAVRNARMWRTIRERTERVVTARIKAERRFQQLEKYQRFFDLAGDGLIVVDGRGQIVFANLAAQASLGFSADDLTQIRLHDIVESHSEDVVEELLAGFRQGTHMRRVDLPIIRADGKGAILSLATASLEPESEASVVLPPGRWSEIATIISIRDVTETRRIQNELKKTKEFLERLIESTADAIVAADTNGNILIFNPGAEKITGYRAEAVIGTMHVSKLYLPGVSREIYSRLWSEKYGGVGKYIGGHHDLVTAEGARVPISLAASLVMDQGNPIASVGIFSDLRDRIRMEEELAMAQRQLQLTERQSAIVELAGTAAHELSQPLTTIVGTLELMQRKLPPDSAHAATCERILAECDRMAEILKKIGQVTKYETKPYVGASNILDLDAASKKENKP